MSVSVSPSIPELAAVVEMTEGAAYANLLHAAPPEWGCVGWRHYLASLDGAPIAAAALFVAGTVGWLGVASTLPQARRHGAQGALLARRAADASAMGCRHIITETSEELSARPNPSFRNMMRAGFAVVYHRPNYMLAVEPGARAIGGA